MFISEAEVVSVWTDKQRSCMPLKQELALERLHRNGKFQFRTTLQNRKKGWFLEISRPGPSTVLTTEEEAVLCDWLIELCRIGIQIQKALLLDSIQRILTDEPRPNPFTCNRPGKGWFKTFLRRQNCSRKVCRANLSRACSIDWGMC